jgi:hypothetical protein
MAPLLLSGIVKLLTLLPGVPVVLEQKTTILWKCLSLLDPLKDSRMVKKLMRPFVRSISAARQAVHDTELGFHTLGLG